MMSSQNSNNELDMDHHNRRPDNDPGGKKQKQGNRNVMHEHIKATKTLPPAVKRENKSPQFRKRRHMSSELRTQDGFLFSDIPFSRSDDNMISLGTVKRELALLDGGSEQRFMADESPRKSPPRRSLKTTCPHEMMQLPARYSPPLCEDEVNNDDHEFKHTNDVQGRIFDQEIDFVNQAFVEECYREAEERLELLGDTLNRHHMILLERQADILQLRMMIVNAMIKFDVEIRRIKTGDLPPPASEGYEFDQLHSSWPCYNKSKHKRNPGVSFSFNEATSLSGSTMPTILEEIPLEEETQRNQSPKISPTPSSSEKVHDFVGEEPGGGRIMFPPKPQWVNRDEGVSKKHEQTVKNDKTLKTTKTIQHMFADLSQSWDNRDEGVSKKHEQTVKTDETDKTPKTIQNMFSELSQSEVTW